MILYIASAEKINKSDSLFRCIAFVRVIKSDSLIHYIASAEKIYKSYRLFLCIAFVRKKSRVTV